MVDVLARFHELADLLQVGEDVLDAALDARGVVNRGGVEATLLGEAPDLGDVVDVVAHAHGIEGELAQARLRGGLDDGVVGSLARSLEHRVAGDVTRAALGDLALDGHVDALGPGAGEQRGDRIHHIGKLAAVDRRKGVGLAPDAGGVDAPKGAENDVNEVVAHGVERESAAGNRQVSAPASPRQIGAVAALAAVFRHVFLSFVTQAGCVVTARATSAAVGTASGCKQEREA